MPRSIVIAASLIALATGAGSRADQEVDAGSALQLERGRYLVEAVMACDSCHTPRGPRGLDMSRRFAGGTEVWDEATYRVQGSNISSDPETGIGAWSDEDLKRLLTEGVRPDGVRVAPKMPYGLYRALTPADLEAVVAFVRSVEPQRNQVPPPVYKTPDYAGPEPPPLPPRPGIASGDRVARGAYLGTLAYCMACHSRRPSGALDLRDWQGRGGFLMEGSYDPVVVSDITASKTHGIGALSDAELRRALTEGVGRDVRKLGLPMARQAFYSRMTDEDLTDLIAWLRTIPPGE